MTRKPDFTEAPIPSPEEIAERAEAIRKGWSEAERIRRWCGGARVTYAGPVAIEVDEDDCD